MSSRLLSPSKWRSNKSEKDGEVADPITPDNQLIGKSIATVQSLISPYYRIVSDDPNGTRTEVPLENHQDKDVSKVKRFSWIGRQKEQHSSKNSDKKAQNNEVPATKFDGDCIAGAERETVASSSHKGSRTRSEDLRGSSQTTYKEFEPRRSLDQVDLQLQRFHQQGALSAIERSQWKEAEVYLGEVLDDLNQSEDVTIHAEWILKLIEVQSSQSKWVEAYHTGESTDLQAIPSLKLVSAIRYAMSQAALNDGKKDSAKLQCAKIIKTCRYESDLQYYLEQSIVCMSSILKGEGKEDEAQIYLSLLPNNLRSGHLSNGTSMTRQTNDQATATIKSGRNGSVNASIASTQAGLPEAQSSSRSEIRRKPVGNSFTYNSTAPGIPARNLNRALNNASGVTSLSQVAQEVVKSTDAQESDDSNEHLDSSNYENPYFTDQNDSQKDTKERQDSISKSLVEHYKDVQGSVDYTPINPYQSQISPENLIPPHERRPSDSVFSTNIDRTHETQKAFTYLQIEPFGNEKSLRGDISYKFRNIPQPALTPLQTQISKSMCNKDNELLAPAGLEVYIPEQDPVSGLEVYATPNTQREAAKELDDPIMYHGRPGYGGLEVAHDIASQTITSADISYSDEISLPNDSRLLAKWKLYRAFDGITIVGSKEDIWRAIMGAIVGPDLERLSYLLFRDPRMIEHKDKENYGALHWAAFHGNHHAVYYLIISGANVNMKTDNYWTPLHWASLRGHHPVAELLLLHGADPNSQVQNGSSAMHWAAQNGHFHIVALLLDFGANPNMLTFASCTPLHSASQHGWDVVARVLLDWRADVNSISENGSTPLHCAVQGGHVNVARVLLDAGANLSTKTRAGRTPRKLAKDKEMIGFLDNYSPSRVIQ